MKVLNYGSLNLDNVYKVPHFVQPGETLSSEALAIHCGGKGLNQSVALARAGARVWHAGAVGAVDGGPLQAVLAGEGINDEHLLRLEDARSGHAIIQVDEKGQNSIILFAGANKAVPQAHVDRTLEHFEAGDYLVLQNEVNGNAYIMEQAHKKGMVIVLNPSPMNEEIMALPLEHVDWFMVNEVEAQSLCGGSGADLLKKYPNAGAVLTLGKRGVECYTGGERYTHGTYEVPVVDTTAAGDTFSGFFIARLAAGEAPPEALRLASIASSIAVSRPGAQASIPSLAEVRAHTMQYVPFD